MNKKYSDDEIVQAYARLGTQLLVSKELGCSQSVVSQALKRNDVKANGYKRNGLRLQKITDEELIKACKTLSSGEIQQKYDIKQCSLYERCKKLGISPVEKKQEYNKGLEKNHRLQRLFADVWHYWEPHAKKFADRTDYTYLESKGTAARVRCNNCGTVIEHNVTGKKLEGLRCIPCEWASKELDLKRTELIKALRAFAIYKEDKRCACCGKSFHSLNVKRIYCSDTCKRTQTRRNNPKSQSYRGRCRRHGVHYDSSVKREKILKRDGLTCRICGKLCDPNDKRWGSLGPDYPTLDHIIPLAKGGTHTWDNVQCACAMCNSYKRDLLAAEMEVS